MGRRVEICIDATEPDGVRAFWRTALAYVDELKDDGAVDLVDPEGEGPTVWFQRVPEARTAEKNRLHLDIFVTDPEREELAARLVTLGGKILAIHPGFTVLADPEGNELCLTLG